jgi:hypothetical protein
MFIACEQGHLDVAKWLFEVGAAEDIRTKDNVGNTPMLIACREGHHDVATWLFEVGAAEDVRTKDNDGQSPLYDAAAFDIHDSIMTWLVIQGAANDEASYHVDAAILARDTYDGHRRTTLHQNLTALLDQHSIFIRLVIPAAHTANAAPVDAIPSACDAIFSEEPHISHVPSPLALLCGHEESLLALIADFVGVVRGRQLRNAREAAAALIAIEENEMEEEEEEQEEEEEEQEEQQ